MQAYAEVQSPGRGVSAGSQRRDCLTATNGCARLDGGVDRFQCRDEAVAMVDREDAAACDTPRERRHAVRGCLHD